MSKNNIKPRQTGIYVRLCRDFKAQAEIRSPDFDTSKLLAEKFPWVSNHPWSRNGIPDDFEGLEFSIIKELREEFALIAKTYDPDEAHSYECAAIDMEVLLHKQKQEDYQYVCEHGSDAQIEKLMQAGSRFLENHFNNEDSHYYGTYAALHGFGLNLVMGKHLSERSAKKAGGGNAGNDPKI